MLQVSPKCTKTWKFRYIELGKPVVITVGRYPDLSLDDARKRTTDLRVKALSGETIRKDKSNVFETFVRDWHKYQSASSNWSDKHTQVVIRLFEMYVFPFIGIHNKNPPKLAGQCEGLLRDRDARLNALK